MSRSAWGEGLHLPRGLGRGRRWGDVAWTLASLCQAWLMGGREGCWPRTAWQGRPWEGPRPLGPPTGHGPLPDPAWVARMRHGTPEGDPHRVGRRETPGQTLAWEALLEGDVRPWMAEGARWLTRRERLAWVPLLAQVEAGGGLDLPPLLEDLVPSGMRVLPAGWWDRLLWDMDDEGRLLPRSGAGFPAGSEGLLGRHVRELETLLCPDLPLDLRPWATPLAGLGWMVDPALRAWVRGQGACPEALEALTLAEPAPQAPAAACMDPGAWLAWGREREPGAREARWAYASAEALAQVAGDACLAGVVAEEAFHVARQAGFPDREDGTLTPLQLAELAHDAGASAEALARLEALPEPWTRSHADLLGRLALGFRDLERARRALDGAEGPLARLLGAWLEGRPLPREGDLALEVAALEGTGFWEAWAACRSRPRRLVLGLERLASCPEDATGLRLAALGSLLGPDVPQDLQARLASFWPRPGADREPTPEAVLEAWCRGRSGATWVLAAGRSLGPGEVPAPLRQRLEQEGYLPPTAWEGRIWWGRGVSWEGEGVGWVLQAAAPEEALPDGEEILAQAAPWMARLAPARPPAPAALEGPLLADGSEPMASLLREAFLVAPTPLPVLVLGPTGSGKELLARELHTRSGRRGALVPVNCAALAEGLLESELFGHVRGAFTGADRERAGAFEAADGGTLFLDEVADLGPRTQSLLLRALQDGEVRKVGSDRARRVDVRVVAATHLDLEARVAAGAFRRDLYYRLQGAVLALPSLAERRHEFPFLIPRMLARQAVAFGREAPSLGGDVVAGLAARPWHGNFRELGHALARALARCPGGRLQWTHFQDLGPECADSAWTAAQRSFRRRFLLDSLRRHGFRVAEAARALGLARPALYQAARQAGLDLVAERVRFEGERG